MAEDEKDKSKVEDEKPNEEASVSSQQDSADALSRTPEELEEERTEKAAADTDLSGLDGELPEKKISPIKKIFRKVNVYLLIFIIILVVVGIFTYVSYLNSQKPPETATIDSQSLTNDALKQLANTDASVGNASQTLTIQGSAVIAGQTLMRGNLNVAGNFQVGGSVQAPTITISGATNLGATQANSLQVATNTALQGATTMRDVTVAGAASFGGTVTASQITVTRLILSGNATLEVPNHISFTGSTPGRVANNGVLGNGGTSSVSGSDTAGTINVSSGNNPTAGCFIRINFAQTFPRTPHVIVSPVGSAAGQMQFYTDRNTGGFSVCSANTPVANQTFAFDYFVTY